MTALLKLALPDHEHKPHLQSETRKLLNRLRFYAAICRSSARLDFFGACALLDPDAIHAEEIHIEVLLRVLGEALDTRPTFHRPNAEAISFDEAWLVATIEAKKRGDDDSFAFLINRRIARQKRREFAMLVSGLADILTKKV